MLITVSKSIILALPNDSAIPSGGKGERGPKKKERGAQFRNQRADQVLFSLAYNWGEGGEKSFKEGKEKKSEGIGRLFMLSNL